MHIDKTQTLKSHLKMNTSKFQSKYQKKTDQITYLIQFLKNTDTSYIILPHL